MNDEERERFEAELRNLPPASLPQPLMARLQAAKPGFAPARPGFIKKLAAGPGWQMFFRWLAPCLAVAAAAVFLVRGSFSPLKPPKQPVAAVPAGLKADDVQVDQELVASFDVVATLPGGQPVRFRCRQMKDEWVVTDTRRGVEIDENRPSVEVTPLRFETY